jgi:penicillin-binding protein 2
VPPEVVVVIEEQKLELPGVIIDIEPLREYPKGSLLAHVLGYVRQIDEEQLKRHRNDGYSPGDPYGQSGIENTYEKYLRGQDGGRQVEVDAQARPVRDLGVKKPVPGHNLVLTINHRVQQAAEEALAQASQQALREGYREPRAGSAVVLDVHTGAVLAMASYPGYDPDLLSGFLSQEDYAEIFESPWKPLLNRAIIPYAPGSTFKMIVAVAALESKSATPQDSIYDPGYFIHDNSRFDDWRAGGHGTVNMIRALKVSCDPYFYQLGLKTGIENIAKYCEEFGLGVKTGIELPGENAGVIPSPDSKLRLRTIYLKNEERKQVQEIEKQYSEQLAKADGEASRKQLITRRSRELSRVSWELGWHDYDTIISSIGQGDTQFSALGLANYVATIANGGTLYKPFLVQRVEDPNGQVVLDNTPEVLNKVPLAAGTLEVVRTGMYETTRPPDGTANFFAALPVAVAAKTGTAEVAGHDNHALVVGYAPYDNPEIAVAVVMDYAGRGGAMAGPVVRSIMAEYFDQEE